MTAQSSEEQSISRRCESESEATCAGNPATDKQQLPHRKAEGLEAGDIEALVEEAYREGYRTGFVDANFADDEEDAIRKIDSIAILDGWSDSKPRDRLLAALEGRGKPSLEPFADALEYFWNASLNATHPHQDATANAVMAGMVEGFAAVAHRLREHSRAALSHKDQGRG